MYCQLSNVDKRVLVSECRVKSKHLHHRPLHEVDHGKHSGGGELTVAHVCHVHLLKEEERSEVELGLLMPVYWFV